MLCFAALLKRDDFRESFLNSAVAIGLFVVFSTEILSWFKLIAYLPLLACWLVFLLSALAWRFRGKAGTRKPPCQRATLSQKALLALLACVAVITGITAIVAAPNNFDSLTYHLPRVMHWIQNRSVAHYPTNIDRQLVLAPFSEFVMMHLQILSGSDRFANCVQWFAMVGSAVGVSLIARSLKGSLNCQIVSAAFAVSLPMGLLQSTSTQNDYAVTFWLVCLVYFIIEAKEQSGPWQALWVGICLALAILTKGTAYLVAAPFMMLYLWFLVAKGRKSALTGMLVVAFAILLVNGGHFARNYAVYGSPLSPGTGNDIICKRVDVTSVISCLTRNVATQLTTGFQGANAALRGVTGAVHHAIGVEINDPQLTADDNFTTLPPEVLDHEDYAPNPLHMALLLFSGGVLAVRRRSFSRETVLLAAAATLSFVVLSMSLKWTPYLSRYFLPVFVISAPVVGLVCDGIKLRSFVNLCAAALIVSSFFVLAHNARRPLVGPQSVFVTDRIDQYFMVNPQAKYYFNSLAGMAKAQQAANIGIMNNSGNMLEYLLWVVLKENGVECRVEHVDVKNPSGNIKLHGFSPYFPVSI